MQGTDEDHNLLDMVDYVIRGFIVLDKDVATWPPHLPISDVAAAPPKRGVVAKLEAAK